MKTPSEKRIKQWEETERKGKKNYQLNKGKEKVSKWSYLSPHPIGKNSTSGTDSELILGNTSLGNYGQPPLPNSKPARKPSKPIAHQSKKRSNKNDAEDEKWYRRMWDGTPEEERYCRECFALTGGKTIITRYDRTWIAHILGKGAHPKLRHNDDNWVFLCFPHHDQLDHGKKRELKIWEDLKKRSFDLLKIEYNT